MTGLLDVADRVWPVLLFLALIQVVADLCDDAGLFDVSAHVAARVAGGSRLRLFLLFTLLATVCTWVLSIDTTAVLLAPIGLALAAELGLSALPFAFASIWLANAGSLLLPVSNLTNLLAQSHLDLGAAEFVRETWLPQLAVLVVVLGVLLLRHRVALRGCYDGAARAAVVRPGAAVARGPRRGADRPGDRARASRPGWWRWRRRWCWCSVSSYAAPRPCAPVGW